MNKLKKPKTILFLTIPVLLALLFACAYISFRYIGMTSENANSKQNSSLEHLSEKEANNLKSLGPESVP